MGCEVDIRTDGSKLVLNHDPLSKGDDFLNFIDQYDHGTLVLNIKESGIEHTVLSELQKRNIKNYFLLDVEFPFLLLLVSGGHCQILGVNGVGDYELYGQTIDDAIG